MGPTVSVEGNTFAAIDGGMKRLEDHIHRTARRSWRFSILSWIFGVAVAILLIIPVQTTTMTSSGGTQSSGPAWYAHPIVFLGFIALLAVIVLEFFLARREALDLRAGNPENSPQPAREGGWVLAVQQSQKVLTRMKNVVEFSLLPLAFGLIVLGVAGVSDLAGGMSLAQFWWLLIGLVPTVVLVPSLFVLAHRWVGGFQQLLDRQVHELSLLEAEFIWRFAGKPA